MSIAPENERTLVIALPSETTAIGLAVVLTSRAEIHILSIAHTLDAAIAAVNKLEPEVVIVGTEWLPAFSSQPRRTGRAARIVAFGAQRHLGSSAETAAATACAYISYLTPSKNYLPLLDVATRCDQPTLRPDAMPCKRCPIRVSLKPSNLPLTQREHQVLAGIGSGFRSVDIAAQMGISVKTVEAHRESIKSKLGLNSARELTVTATDWCRGDSP